MLEKAIKICQASRSKKAAREKLWKYTEDVHKEKRQI